MNITTPKVKEYSIASKEFEAQDIKGLKKQFRRINTNAKQFIDHLNQDRELLKTIVNEIGGSLDIQDENRQLEKSDYRISEYNTTYTYNRKSASVTVVEKTSHHTLNEFSTRELNSPFVTYDVQVSSNSADIEFEETICDFREVRQVENELANLIEEFDSKVDEYIRAEERRLGESVVMMDITDAEVAMIGDMSYASGRARFSGQRIESFSTQMIQELEGTFGVETEIPIN